MPSKTLLILPVVVSLLLGGCKIIQITPSGGSIVSASGEHDCSPNQTCEIDVVNGETFSDTFTAIPKPGYKFVKWKKAPSYLCGNSRGSCDLINVPPALTEKDVDLILAPVFVKDSDNDGVEDRMDFFPADRTHYRTEEEIVCLGPDWVYEPPQNCFTVDTATIGGEPQSSYKVRKPGVLSVELQQRRRTLSAMPTETVNQFCADFAASSYRIPKITAAATSVHLQSWEGQSVGIDSHIEAAIVTFTNLQVEGGLALDEFSFQFSIAEEAQTVDFYFDPGLNPELDIAGLQEPFYLLVTLSPQEVYFRKYEDRYRLNTLPEDTRNLLLSVMKNAHLLMDSDVDLSAEDNASIRILDSPGNLAQALVSFANPIFERPIIQPLDEIWCSDDFDTCAEFIPNREFRDTLVNFGADYLAFADAKVGAHMLRQLRLWAKSDAFLNVRGVTLGVSQQDDFWPRYEINMIMVSVLEAWSLLQQDNVPSASDILLIEGWIGKVLSFTTLTTSGGPNTPKEPFNIGYLEASLKMAWGILQNNDAMLVDGIEKVYLSLHQMNEEGGFPREIARGGASYGYQNIVTMSVMYMANLASIQGYDVFAWEVEGKRLQDMIDFNVNSAKDPTVLENYATEFDYYWTPLPINFESSLAIDANGRSSKYSHGKMFGAWFEPYLALFPSEKRRVEIDSILLSGLERSRPVYHEMVGTNTTCYFATP
jgi:Alginate lyase